MVTVGAVGTGCRKRHRRLSDSAYVNGMLSSRRSKLSGECQIKGPNMIASSNCILPQMFAVTAVSWICTVPTHAQSIDELYQKARVEKTVALYGAGPTGSHDRWVKEFEQRFPGVTVTFTGGLSTALNKKIETQLINQKVETDLAILQTIQDFAKWKKTGAMLPFK